MEVGQRADWEPGKGQDEELSSKSQSVCKLKLIQPKIFYMNEMKECTAECSLNSSNYISKET